MITAETLRLCLPAASADNIARYVDHMDTAMAEFDISTPLRAAPFIATIGTESQDLARVSENLNYTPQGILATFSKYFTPQQAELYGRTDAHPANQQAIANIAYANRNGNGDLASGDGWLHRGAGGIQLTFADNHRRCGEHFGIALAGVPDWLRTPEGAMRSAGWFWLVNDLNALADVEDFLRLSQRVNGSGNRFPNGWEDRLHRLKRVRGVLGFRT